MPRKGSIIDLGHTQFELFSFTSRPTDPILRKGQPEKQNIKLKWPKGILEGEEGERKRGRGRRVWHCVLVLVCIGGDVDLVSTGRGQV